jgi:hypothetical protein
MDQDHAQGSASRVDGASPLSAGSTSRRGRIYLLAALLGLGLVGLWVGLFIVSLRQDRLVLGGMGWIPILPSMGADFKQNIDHIVRVRALGYKPHQVPNDPFCLFHPYPPMIARSFSWVLLFDIETASLIWLVALASFASLGCFAAWRTRKRLGLDSIPLSLMVAAVLFSTPFIYVLERGQWLIVVAWLLGRRGTWAELGAGALLGLTAWIKYYPGLAVVALLTLGRRKALATFAAVVALIGIVDLGEILESIKAGQKLQAIFLGRVGGMLVWSHSIVESWKSYDFVRESHILNQVPGFVLSGLLLLPVMVLVGRRIARAKDPQALTLPYMLWLAAVATFALPYSNDYNLVTLPLTVLAVWDRRDRAVVQAALALSLLWLQPFWLPIDGGILALIKLGAVYAAGACLVARATVDGQRSMNEGPASLFRPTFARLKGPHDDAALIDPGSERI